MSRGTLMSNDNPVTDADFFHIGFTGRQVLMLRGQSDTLRRIVYEEGLRILMENGPGYSGDHAVNL